MGISLADYQEKARAAVRAFWQSREDARKKQIASGSVDHGERAGVTTGKNMDGFAALMKELVVENGLPASCVQQRKALLTLPGYFRPTKLWDILVINSGRLVAAIELKSQVGPSFGNNFNNRTEEAIGTAHDFWTAYREDAFGPHPRPFLAWMILVEDAPESKAPVRDKSPHFKTFPEFQGASYIMRYDILCRRLVQEQLYSAACVITSPRSAVRSGVFQDVSELTSLKTLVTSFAGHIAAEAARA